MNYMQDSKEKEKRQTQTTMDRQCKGRHRINWTDIEGSNGLDKGLRTIMEVIHSYPLPQNGWRLQLMMMMHFHTYLHKLEW